MRVLLPLGLAVLLAGCGGSSGDPLCRDRDKDGYGEGVACISLDCNDDDETIHPGAEERIGDGVDSDCNNTERCYADLDDDGFRTDEVKPSPNATCDDQSEAYEDEPTGDCDDTDPLAHEGAQEITGTGKDESCDGRELCYVDQDHDGARGTATMLSQDADCSDPGEALASARIDCDEGSSEDTPYTYYADVDADGVGAGTAVIACTPPAGHAQTSTDCDPEDGSVYVMAQRYRDEDGDGFGTGAATSRCTGTVPELGYAAVSGDCADTNPTAYPGAPELPDDAVDQDCVGGDLVMNETNGVFVRQGASDSNAGTRAAPVGTIGRALMLATGSKSIFLAAGTYAFDPATMPFERSFFGGYANDFSSRSAVESVLESTYMFGLAGGELALERVHLRVTGDVDATPAALIVVQSTITLRDVRITRSGTEDGIGMIAGESTVVAERVRIDVSGITGTCAGLRAYGGRALVHRSRVQTCSGVAGDVIGISAGAEGVAPIALGLFNNVLDLGVTSALATAVSLEGTRAHAVLANNTFAFAGTTGEKRGVRVVASEEAFTRVTAVNNIVAADSSAAAFACFEVPAARAMLAIEGNACSAMSAGCFLTEGAGCVPYAEVTSCAFDACTSSVGNVVGDPGFSDAARHLAAASMCVDAGVATDARVPSALVSSDVDGDARPMGAGRDIGADERVP